MKLKLSMRAKFMLSILAVVAITYIAIVSYIGLKYRSSVVSDAKMLSETNSKVMALQVKNELDIQINNIYSMINSLKALNITSGSDIINGSKNQLKTLLESNDNLSAVWLDWDISLIRPDLKKSTGYVRQIYYKDDGKTSYFEELADTTGIVSESIYEKIKITGKILITEPKDFINMSLYTDHSQKIGIAVPIYLNGQFAGIAGTDVILNPYLGIQRFEAELAGAYSFLVSSKGNIINHPELNFQNINLTDYLIKSDMKYQVIENISRGKSFSFISHDKRTGKKVYYSFAPVKFDNSNYYWSSVIVTPINKIVYKINRNIALSLFIGILGFIILGFVIWYITGNITNPLIKTTRILKNLALGDINNSLKLKVDTEDEIGEMAESVNMLIEGLNSTTLFAKEIGRGNLDVEYKKLSDRDILGDSLIEMRENLKLSKQEEQKRKIEDAKQNWATQGLAKFGEILRQNADNLESFAYNIISNLVKYVDANQGGLFIINEDENKEKYVELISCFAYDRQKFIQKKLLYGEGLIGRCILEKATIHLTDIPTNYLEITSGLGKENPRSLLIIPLLLNEEVYGVIEMASFKDFEPHVISFVEKIGESIASTISNVKVSIRTAKLLEETKIQAEELAAQEEEMRQNLEELQATQEESARKEAELSGIVSAINASLIYAEFDTDGNIISCNKEFANVYGVSKEIINGSSFQEIAENAGITSEKLKQIWSQLKNGEMVKIITQLIINNEETWLNQTFSPIYNNEGKIYKYLNIAIDITETKKQEKKVENLLLEAQRKNEELKQIQDDLIKEKSLMDALMFNIPDNIYFKDLQSRFLRVSNNMMKLFGVNSVDEIIGKSDFDFFSEEHARPAFEDEQRIIRTGEPIIDLVEKEVRRDGQVSWASTTKMPLRNEKGEIIGTFGISRDITRTKQMEIDAIQVAQELKESREELKQNIEEMKATQEELLRKQEELMWENSMFNALMNFLPDRIAFKDKEGRFIRVNKAKALRHKLNDPSEIIGKTDYDFFAKEHADKARKEEQELIATGIALRNHEERIIWQDGTVTWGSTSRIPFTDNSNNVIGMLIFTQDITNIKLAEINIFNYSNIINGISENVPVLYYRTDAKGNITECKGIGLNYMAVTEKAIVGKELVKVFPAASDIIKTKKISDPNIKYNFIIKGKYKNKAWEMEHFIFANQAIEGGIVGYAYKKGLV
jgi:methyl-accepting chemotaxis protein